MDNDNNLLKKAWLIAENAHHHQMYGDEPYINHIKRVYERVKQLVEPTDHQTLAIAILHDVIEDSDVSINEVFGACGIFVSDMVSTLTHKRGETYKQYLERVNHFHTARLVKVCDLLDNLSHSYLSNDLYRISKYEKALVWFATQNH
jgi:(p)ppGpp synthase/HD superfamily hydrolase